MFSGSGTLNVLTYSPDGHMIAELAGGVDFNEVAHRYSCVAAGIQPTTVVQLDPRGWSCFDIAHVGTVANAMSTMTPQFGQNCSGSIVGDGQITVEDIIIVLMVHYRIPPYDGVSMAAVTITAPLAGHSERCESSEANGTKPLATCASAIHGRRMAAAFEPTLQVRSQSPGGMWVMFTIPHPNRLASCNLYIDTASPRRRLSASMPVATTTVSNQPFENVEARKSLEGTVPAVMYDKNNTGFNYFMGADNTISGAGTLSIGGRVGQPILYVWTPSTYFCVRETSTVSRVADTVSDAVYVYPEGGTCVHRRMGPAVAPPLLPYVSPLSPPPAPSQPPPPLSPPRALDEVIRWNITVEAGAEPVDPVAIRSSVAALLNISADRVLVTVTQLARRRLATGTLVTVTIQESTSGPTLQTVEETLETTNTTALSAALGVAVVSSTYARVPVESTSTDVTWVVAIVAALVVLVLVAFACRFRRKVAPPEVVTAAPVRVRVERGHVALPPRSVLDRQIIHPVRNVPQRAHTHTHVRNVEFLGRRV
jgi:hypothetical protein